MTVKTPGVYVQEISLFPPSVAEVETAIPAFIGYTQKAEKKGESLRNIPTKISSLLEYHIWFGVAYDITQVNVVVDEDNNFSVDSLTIPKRFYLYDAIRTFFDNGGGDCYIVSVGSYTDTPANGNGINAGFKLGLNKVEKFDEPTILLFPDAVLMGDTDLFALQQAALAQANKLQDRVGLFDLKQSDDWESDVDAFRNGIGINNLKYGTAYMPWLITSYTKVVNFSIFKEHVTDKSTAAVDLTNITTDSDLNQLVVTTNTALADITAFDAKIDSLNDTFPTIEDRYKDLRTTLINSADDTAAETNLTAVVEFLRELAQDFPTWLTALNGKNLLNDLNSYAKDKLSVVEDLIGLEKNAMVVGITSATVDTEYASYDTPGWLSDIVANLTANGDDYTVGATLGSKAASINVINGIADSGLDTIFAGIMEFITSIKDAANIHSANAQKVLYEGHSIIGNIAESIKRELAKVPPSGAVAGIYAFVDRNRGVWKSPANVSLSSVNGPVAMIDHSDQESLNIDVNAGKSINAIRTFTGKGTLIWGARTLAGNDNEWRYISVRRFFNMVEESVKKSTGWAVFEPNDANTWTKVKTMIDNYLVQKWRDGALQGATPDKAFFVNVGLGLTMTAVDILEGRMNVEIGMAVVRPAEFIILKFSHKMVEV